jgi:hypothetical protein
MVRAGDRYRCGGIRVATGKRVAADCLDVSRAAGEERALSPDYDF